MGPKPRKLNVYQAQFGFHDCVVAAANQGAALRAWGTHRNLFADGEATITDDPQAVEAALANPEVPLRRAVGTHEPFSLTPSLPEVPGSAPSRRQAAAPKRKPKAPPPPDRSRLSAAEAALEAVEAAWRAEQQDFRSRREALDRDEQAAADKARRDRAAAEDILKREQQAYRTAGGR